MLNSLNIDQIKCNEMTFEFFLPSAGTVKNIQLRLSDQQQKKTFSFRTFLRISEEDWDTEKQRPKNIYLKKYKKLNTKLDMIKKELAEYVCKMRMEKKCWFTKGNVT